MEISKRYLAVGLFAFILLVVLLFFMRNKKAQLSAVSILAFSLVLAGMAWGEDNGIGYGFPIVAIVLSVVDVFGIKKFHR